MEETTDTARSVLVALGGKIEPFALTGEVLDQDAIAAKYGERFRGATIMRSAGWSEYDDNDYYQVGVSWWLVAPDVRDDVVGVMARTAVAEIVADPDAAAEQFHSGGGLLAGNYYEFCFTAPEKAWRAGFVPAWQPNPKWEELPNELDGWLTTEQQQEWEAAVEGKEW